MHAHPNKICLCYTSILDKCPNFTVLFTLYNPHNLLHYFGKGTDSKSTKPIFYLYK